MDGRKAYRVLVKWGEARSTDDREGVISALSSHRPEKIDIESILKQFEGNILQTPPKFSAIKVAGERAYDLARAGADVVLAGRMVTIEKITLLAQPDADHAEFEVACGKGAYIRSLARDLALALGTVGHVASLRRTRVGPFGPGDMISLEKLEELRHKAPGDNAMEGVLRPLETVLDGIPALAVKDAEAQRLRQGQLVLLRGASAPIAQDAVLVMWAQRPLGICSIEKGALKPKRLFNL
jgi:tRNA pseudouridine55 synthase